MAISPEEVQSLSFLLFSLECEAAEIQAETRGKCLLTITAEEKVCCSAGNQRQVMETTKKTSSPRNFSKLLVKTGLDYTSAAYLGHFADERKV